LKPVSLPSGKQFWVGVGLVPGEVSLDRGRGVGGRGEIHLFNGERTAWPVPSDRAAAEPKSVA